MKIQNNIIAAIFWICSFALVHTYALYPVVLSLISQIVESDHQELPADLPTVSLVIAAYNEEDVIAEKIENSIALDYPAEKLELIVFSDASSDRTDEIVESYADEGVELIRVEGRVGKTECQNVVAEQVGSEIIVFSDANSMYDPDAIRELIRGFGPSVDCVVGELRYSDDSDVDGESTYWRYERLIKRLESKLGSIVTGNGSIYAVRTSSYVPLPRDAISDFAEPLALIENGSRIAYAPTAIARERTDQSVESELSRRVRIVTRSWNTLSDHTALLNPRQYPVFSFKLFSHKVFRWLSPVFLVGALATSVVLTLVTRGLFYPVVLGFQIVFYLCALVGAISDRVGRQVSSIFHIPYYFVVSNYGMGLALVNFLKQRNIVTWETAERAADD